MGSLLAAGLGGIIVTIAGRVARALARKTKNKTDDRVVEAVVKFLDENPEIVEAALNRSGIHATGKPDKSGRPIDPSPVPR